MYGRSLVWGAGLLLPRRASIQLHYLQVSSEGGFPFKKTGSNLFDVVVACNENQFAVCSLDLEGKKRWLQFYVNDVLLASFDHVVAPRTIDKIVVHGDIVLHGVHLKWTSTQTLHSPHHTHFNHIPWQSDPIPWASEIITYMLQYCQIIYRVPSCSQYLIKLLQRENN